MPISDELLDEGGAFHNVRAAEFGAAGTGGVDDGPAFQDAGAQGHVLVPAGIYRLDNSLTISRALRFIDGAVLLPANGVTVTLDGPVEAGPYKIFDSSLGGTVAFGNNSAENLYPEWWGAVGDGDAANATADTEAIKAAVAAAGGVKGTVVFRPDATYLLSRTIRGAQGIRWQFNNTTLKAFSGGTYDDIIDSTGPTGLKVLFATDRGRDSIHTGKLIVNGNNVPDLCGISGSESANAGAGLDNQTWEWVQIGNCERGIYALRHGAPHHTLIGHHFGFVQFFGCNVDLYVENNGADDAVFNVVRSRSNVSGSTGVFLDRMNGLTFGALFITSFAGVTRTGIHLEGGSSLSCDHLFIEGPFDDPILVRDASCLLIRDLAISTAISSTNDNLISLRAGGGTSPAGVVDVTVNNRINNSPTALTHIVRIVSMAASNAGRTVLLRMPFGTGAIAPVVYTGSNPSQNDYVVVNARNGKFRYFYDGTNLTTLREPLVVGGTVGATTLGSVTDRMEVFDPNGDSIGFVPIYDSIT